MAAGYIYCPCGSGKMYEDCCGKFSNVISLNQLRMRRTGRSLRRKLGDYVGRKEFSGEASRAQELYFQHLDVSIADFGDDFLMERCFEWFVFDFKLHDGERVISKFQRGSSLTRDEKLLLGEWVRAVNGLYEVKAVLPEKLFLEDIITREQIIVMDVNVVKRISPGYILYMRVLQVGVENEFSTSGFALPNYCKKILIKKLFSDALRFWEKRNSPEDWNIYLRERSHIVNGMVMQMTAESDLDWFSEEDEENNNEEMDASDATLLNESDEYHNMDDFLNARCIAAEDFPWREKRYQHVARVLAKELHNQSFNCQQVGNALRLWYDYTSLERPSFRKNEAWVATIMYAVSRLEPGHRQSQNSLAKKYGVSSSTISDKYRSMCKILGLRECDERYSTYYDNVDQHNDDQQADNTVFFLSHYLAKRR